MYAHDVHYLVMGCDLNKCTMLHYVQALFAEKHGTYALETPEWPHIDLSEMAKRVKQKHVVGSTVVGRSLWLHLRAKLLVDESLRILEDNPRLIRKIPCVPYGSDQWDQLMTSAERFATFLFRTASEAAS